MSYDFGQYKKDALEAPRNKAWSNWAKFDKVGDTVQGFIRDVFYRPAEGIFKAARGITLETPTGELINVATKRLPFVLASTDHLHIGDPLTIVFEKELLARQAGFKPAKQMGYYGKVLDENKASPTVAELDAADMAAQGVKNAAPDAELDALAKEAAAI